MSDRLPIRITGFDHIVLRVADVERSLDWYHAKLGLPAVRVEQWRQGKAPFPSVRIDSTTIIDLFAYDPAEPEPGPGPGPDSLDHFCLVMEGVGLDDIVEDPGFDVVRGPVRVFGAQGYGHSVYVNDPDGLVVELRTYDA